VAVIGLRMNEIINKLSTLSVEEVAEIAARMFNETASEAAIILDAALSVLESKMPEADFIRFCEKMA
jgi:hypothetical protein